MVDRVVVRPWRATRPTSFVQCQRFGEMCEALLTPALTSQSDRRTLPADRVLELAAFGLRHRHRLGESGRALDLQEIFRNDLGACAIANPIVWCGGEETRERVRESKLFGKGFDITLDTIARLLVTPEPHQT